MNIRQQKYRKNRLKGMNMVNAARSAGYSLSYCKARSYKMDRSENVGLVDEFERRGLTDKKIVEFAIDGMEKATKLFGKDAVEHPDWAARHKFFETALKLSNKIKESGHTVSVSNVNYAPSVKYVFTSDPREAGESIRGVFDTESQNGVRDTEQTV